MLDGTHYIECKCDSTEHVLRYTLDKEEKKIYTEVYLNPTNKWYSRQWLAIKYVFGYRCIYGHWDCTLIKVKDIIKLRDLCEELINEK